MGVGPDMHHVSHFVWPNQGRSFIGAKGAFGPPANGNSHYENSKMDTVHYCSKRVALLICLKFEFKLRQ